MAAPLLLCTVEKIKVKPKRTCRSIDKVLLTNESENGSIMFRLRASLRSLTETIRLPECLFQFLLQDQELAVLDQLGEVCQVPQVYLALTSVEILQQQSEGVASHLSRSEFFTKKSFFSLIVNKN